MDVWARTMITRVLPGRLVVAMTSARRRTVSARAYTIPKGEQPGEILEFSHEIEVKKSRFCAIGWHVDTEEEALSRIREARDPSASHNCWAIRISGRTIQRYNDDGEPGGTGGKPILSALETLYCDHSAIMVTRYFGGTKLGTGGLIRAYGGAARDLLNMIELEEMVAMRRCRVFVPAEAIGIAYGQIEAAGGQATEQDEFDDTRGGFYVSFDVFEGDAEAVLAKLRDASRGKIVVDRCWSSIP